MKTSAVAAFIFFLCVPVRGYRREYSVTFDGARKAGSEVCFFRGGGSGNALDLFFSYDRVACLPADSVLDLPEGKFHVFARHADGLVSAHLDYVSYSGPPSAERGYELLEIPLQEAGIADFGNIVPHLEKDQKVGVWLAPTLSRAGTFRPLVDGETTILVPTDTVFVPVLVVESRPFAIGETMEATRGERRAVERFLATDSIGDVVAWLKPDRDALEGVDVAMDRLDVAIATNNKRLQPLFPLVNVPTFSYPLVFFRAVPHGQSRLVVGGKYWRPVTKEITVKGAITVIEEPVVLSPGGAVTVTWKTGVDSEPACVKDLRIGEPLVATLLACSSNSDERCSPVASRRRAFSTGGSAQFSGVAQGRYKVTLDPPYARQVTSDAIDITPGREHSVNLTVNSFDFFGTVTLNGLPQKATLVFETGVAQSDVAGRYHASLAADPRTNLVTVVLCDTGTVLKHAPLSGPFANAPFDLTLQTRPLAVSVLDPDRSPVPNASVSFAPVRMTPDGPARFYTSEAQSTDGSGRAVFANVPVAGPILVCAKHEIYTPTCSAPIESAARERGAVTVRLDRVSIRGRIEGHEGVGLLAWVDRTGTIREQVRVEPNGSFTFRQLHLKDGHLAYASDRKPLAVFETRPDSNPQNELILSLPSGPPISFSVSLDAKGISGFVGLWLGGRYVPLAVLAYHQEARGRDVVVSGDHALVIEDISAVAPIAVGFALQRSQTSGAFVDPFTLPEFAGTKRFIVTSGSVRVAP